jgi:hypothetical protein
VRNVGLGVGARCEMRDEIMADETSHGVVCPDDVVMESMAAALNAYEASMGHCMLSLMLK